jgi:hypothetical protein
VLPPADLPELTLPAYVLVAGHAHRHGTPGPSWIEHSHLGGGSPHRHDEAFGQVPIASIAHVPEQAAEAVQAVLSGRGVWLSGPEREMVARVALESCDEIHEIRVQFVVEASDHVLSDGCDASVRRRLAIEVMERGFVPVAAPVRTVEPGDGWPLDMRVAVWSVPVRRLA